MIPKSFIQDVRARVDIVDLINKYVPLKKAGANYAACCPFHNEKTPSFTVSPTKQFYHCFGCGAHGTAIDFLMEYQGMDFVDAVKELAASMGMQVPEDRAYQGDSAGQDSFLRQRLSERMNKAQTFYKNALRKNECAMTYLKNRGLSGEVAARFGIGYAPEGWQALQAVFTDYASAEMLETGLVIDGDSGRRYDRFRARIMFPIINAKDEVIGFGGRVLDQGEPKYLNSPETKLFIKGQELFGLPQAQKALRDENCAIVVEGYMDVVALSQHGVGNVVAALGTATTSTHIQKLLRLVDRIVFCFDGDVAGRKAAFRALENALEVLPDNKTLAFALYEKQEDPDSFIRKNGKEAFMRLIANAEPLSDFLRNELRARYTSLLNDPEEKKRLIVDEAKPLLSKVTAPLLRQQLVMQVADDNGFSKAEVEQLCGIRSAVRSAPPKAPRQAPSLARILLRLVLQKPERAAEVPLEQLPIGAERKMLETIAGSLALLPPEPDYAQLREQLRGDERLSELDVLAGELISMKLDETATVSDEEFRAAVAQLQVADHKAEFARLQTQARQFGVMGMSAEEKERYLALLARKQTPEL
ncbi:DNA primase [Betaproteobacteria bacterium]|nr:DNA primase [Betaproteobacteria bacterium]GHU40791.1 DNA primase [Betaproteobacteria bacterium]